MGALFNLMHEATGCDNCGRFVPTAAEEAAEMVETETDLRARIASLEAQLREREAECTRLRDALGIATVSLTSKWPEDFRAVFTDDELLAMIDRHNQHGDFRIEDVIRAALYQEKKHHD